MDFQKVADGISAMTCIMSVEKLDNGGYGEIRIVAGNKAYIDSIENPPSGVVMLDNKFVPNCEYTRYLQKDLNFEDFCYRSAVGKKCLHSYVHPDRFDVWFNMTFLPLEPDDGNICYCSYTMEMNLKPDLKQMSKLSGDIASSVLETCIMLQDATDLKETLFDVVKAIRELCKAKRCCLVLMDHVARNCNIIGNDLTDENKEKNIDDYVGEDFYDLAITWEDTISGSNCLIAKNAQDMEVVKERNPIWYQTLKDGGIKSIVLFPLRNRQELIGYMWAMDFDPADAPMIKEALESTTFILGSQISNYLLMDRLKVLSSKDMLTGVKNRNEMNNTVDKYAGGNKGRKVPVGIVFADLNGLKTVNDKEGHTEGDNLLKRAAMVLGEVFDEEHIFRAGGDEFAIIIPNATEDKLYQDIENVRRISEKYEGVSFALGCSIADSPEEIHGALREADVRMYEDKRKYYEKHPERLRSASKEGFRYNVEDVNE